MEKIIFPFFLAFSVSYFFTLPTIVLAKKLGLVDDPKKRKHPAHTHQKPIPRAGGISLYLGILLPTIFFLPLNKIILGILLGGFLIVLMGLADDKWDLSPYFRFFLNLLIAAVTILFGLGIPYITNPFGGIIRLDQFILKINFFGERHLLVFADLFSLFWITALMNFVNWSKGVDGQMPGFVAIASFFLSILARRFVTHDISAQSVMILGIIVGGAFLGFLPWNFYPQKIMPGYGGGALAGFFLAVLSILSWGKVGTLLIVLALPLTDAFYVIFQRILNRRSPFKADANHFHHRLLRIGWGRRRIAIFYWLISFLFGFSTLFFKGIQKLLLFFGVVICLAFFIFLTNFLKEKKILEKF